MHEISFADSCSKTIAVLKDFLSVTMGSVDKIRQKYSFKLAEHRTITVELLLDYVSQGCK